MRKPLAILTGLVLATLVAGCNSAQVSQGPPTAAAIRTNQTSNTASDNPVVPISTALPLSKQNAKPLTAVSFVTDKIGFAGSQSGLLYKTTDGGVTWTVVYTASEPIVGITTAHETVQERWYVYAWAWTKDYMIASSGTKADALFRVKFNGHTRPAMGNAPIEDVSIGGNGLAFFVSNGIVFSADGMGGRWLKFTLPDPVAAVANVDDSTVYAATYGGVIYKTTDSGQHWTKVFAAPITVGQGLAWNARVEAAGHHVAVLYVGNGIDMGHQPYVLYESNDGGKTWNNLFDEPYFQPFSYYGSMKPIYTHTLSRRPGPFALLPHGLIAFTGVYPFQNTLATISVITPQGKRVEYDAIGPSANTPNVFGANEMPTAISTPDTTHFFVVGGKGNKAVLEVSTDRGLTWTAK